jgi:aryl-alcohol dehydrogenase-like predicted oxidoreductase
MQAHGLSLIPYYPLASGLLTGKYKRGEPFPDASRFAAVKDHDYASRFVTEANWARIERLTQFAEQRGHRLLELALSWLVANPIVASVIPGATRPEQVEANVQAAAWQLTRDDLEEIDKLA